MNVKIGRLLSMIPKTCTTVNLIYTHRAKYSNTLLAHTVPDHIKVLTARNVQLTLTPGSQLTTLHLDSCDNSNTLQLPTTLKELYVMNSIQLPVLPSKLTVLDMSKSGITEGLSGLIPDTVQTLKLPGYYTSTIGTLPRALVHLDLGLMYTHPIEQLPSTLKHFSMKRNAGYNAGVYEHSLDGVLPSELEVLHVSSLRHSLGVLPRDLKELYYDCSDHSLGVLPRSLRVLQIDSMIFNLSLGQLPESLTELNLNRAYAFDKPLGTLPVALQKLHLHGGYTCNQSLSNGASTLVCNRLSMMNSGDILQEQQDAVFDHFRAIAAARSPNLEFLAQLELVIDEESGDRYIDSDDDDDFAYRNKPLWRRTFDDTDITQ
jgi:hypothetical protein